MHVVLVTVDIKAGRVKEATETLDSFVIPTTKQSSGFVRGVWWHTLDETVGHGLVTFDTEENATAMSTQVVEMPGDAPVTIRSVEVGVVNREA